MHPRLAARLGYLALAATLCVSETTHLPETPYVLAFAIGFGMARFGPPVCEALRGRAFGNPGPVFLTLVAVSFAAEVARVALESAGVARAEARGVEHVALALVYAYVWEILYDLGGPRAKRRVRRATDALVRLVARVHAVHGTAPGGVTARNFCAERA